MFSSRYEPLVKSLYFIVFAVKPLGPVIVKVVPAGVVPPVVAFTIFRLPFETFSFVNVSVPLVTLTPLPFFLVIEVTSASRELELLFFVTVTTAVIVPPSYIILLSDET